MITGICLGICLGIMITTTGIGASLTGFIRFCWSDEAVDSDDITGGVGVTSVAGIDGSELNPPRCGWIESTSSLLLAASTDRILCLAIDAERENMGTPTIISRSIRLIPTKKLVTKTLFNLPYQIRVHKTIIVSINIKNSCRII
jgi:hypothetical protein